MQTALCLVKVVAKIVALSAATKLRLLVSLEARGQVTENGSLEADHLTEGVKGPIAGAPIVSFSSSSFRN